MGEWLWPPQGVCVLYSLGVGHAAAAEAEAEAERAAGNHETALHVNIPQMATTALGGTNRRGWGIYMGC